MTTQVENTISNKDLNNETAEDEKAESEESDHENEAELSNDLDENVDYNGDSESDGESQEKHGLAGMGDVITKILNKNIDSKQTSLVLLKSKGERKRKTEHNEEMKSKKAKEELLSQQKEINHVLPIEENNAVKEAMLKRIATKGVVMLFNAVSAHQKAKAEKMKKAKTEGEKVKVEKSMKKSTFMDMLKNDKTKEKEIKKENNDGNNTESTWDVLKSDFMLGSSLKHWDKDEDDNVKNKKKIKNVKESLDVDTSEDDEED